MECERKKVVLTRQRWHLGTMAALPSLTRPLPSSNVTSGQNEWNMGHGCKKSGADRERSQPAYTGSLRAPALPALLSFPCQSWATLAFPSPVGPPLLPMGLLHPCRLPPGPGFSLWGFPC